MTYPRAPVTSSQTRSSSSGVRRRGRRARRSIQPRHSPASLPPATVPRTAEGKPDFTGIWQVARHGGLGPAGSPRPRRRPGRAGHRGGPRDPLPPGRTWRRSRRTPRTARRSIRRPSASCSASRARCTTTSRSRSSRRTTSSPSPSNTHGLRVRLHQQHAAPAGADRLVDGRLARPMGRRHARRGRRALQRGPAGSSRQLSTATRCTWWSASRRAGPTTFSTEPPSKTRRCSRARWRSARCSTAASSRTPRLLEHECYLVRRRAVLSLSQRHQGLTARAAGVRR